MASLETSLQAVEREIDGALRNVTAVVRELKKAKSAAALGQLRDLRQCLEQADKLADAAANTATDVRTGWTFDEQGYFASGAYAQEVLALARAEGVQAFESDERILCYPAIVAVSTTEPTVTVDRKRERSVRPTVFVRALKGLQSRPPRFKAEAFLESLAAAYDLARSGARPGAVVKLVDLYAVLTVMPGASREYTKQEFARDLYLLDESGVTTTRSGRTMAFSASALTRGGGLLKTVTRSGQEKVYAGLHFSGAP